MVFKNINYSLLPYIQTASWAHPRTCEMGIRVKSAERAVYHSTPSGAEDYNAWTYTATSMYVFTPSAGRDQLKCDGTRAETRFRPSAKRTSPFKSAVGRQFSLLLAAEVCASAVVMLDTPCSEVV